MLNSLEMGAEDKEMPKQMVCYRAGEETKKLKVEENKDACNYFNCFAG